MKRTLTLKKDTVAELGTEELSHVVGGSMLPCLVFEIQDKLEPGGLRHSIDIPCPG